MLSKVTVLIAVVAAAVISPHIMISSEAANEAVVEVTNPLDQLPAVAFLYTVTVPATEDNTLT